MFRVEFAGRRRVPVRVQGFTYLFFLHGVPPDTVHVNLLLTARNKPWTARLDDFVEPLPRLNPVDLVECVCWKRGDIEILSRAGRGFGGGEQSPAALDRPGKQYLCRRRSNSRCNLQDDWIFERSRPDSMTQWRKRQKHYLFLPAELQELRFRKIRMCFDLHRR